MADTTYLKNTVEPFLRDWASRQLGVTLTKRRIEVGLNSEGRPVSFEFDGVSEDGTVGVFISASSSYKTGQMLKYFREATLLNRVSGFTRRIMVFTNENSWQGFKNQCDGLVDLGRIEPMICSDMPAEMRAKIDLMFPGLANEVGAKSGPGKGLHRPRR